MEKQTPHEVAADAVALIEADMSEEANVLVARFEAHASTEEIAALHVLLGGER